MKKIILLIFISSFTPLMMAAQDVKGSQKDIKEIRTLIDQYSLAREHRDTVLLKSILTHEIDQLVSSGEWRSGIQSSLQGMMQSSASNPGNRTLTIEKLRFLNSQSALVDARYEILNADGSIRKMWSSFIVVKQKGSWKISAIRNMLPAKAP
jgi:hypothetical protein